MAHTAHKTDAEAVEHTDPPEVLERKIELLARLFQTQRAPVVWTGAGVSTAAGIPDFRGPTGKWSLAAQGKTYADVNVKPANSIAVHPTVTHMALVGLLDAGRLRGIISSNTDGLHRRSGVPSQKIAELHGNGNLARCSVCKFEAMADARLRCAQGSKQHETGIRCPCCEATTAAAPGKKVVGDMHDTIVNFGEYLNETVYASAEALGKQADLLLVLGSSLRVITCDALEHIQAPGKKLVIVNKQITPYDKACTVRIFANVDDVMKELMNKIGVAIPPWRLIRQVEATVSYAPTRPSGAAAAAAASTKSSEDGIVQVATAPAVAQIRFCGVDEVGRPFSWFKEVCVVVDVGKEPKEQQQQQPDKKVSLVPIAKATLTPQTMFRPLTVALEDPRPLSELVFRFETPSHRGEPPVMLRFPPAPQSASSAASIPNKFRFVLSWLPNSDWVVETVQSFCLFFWC